MVTRDWSDAGLELEASRAVADKVGKKAQGIYLPMDVMARDLTAGTNSAGGYTVGTDMMGGSFIDLLRNRMMVMQMGARLMTGLNGNVAIPRQSGGATAYWVAENGAITESGQTFDQVTMSPKTIGALTDISRRLLLQSSVDVEALVRDDLASTIALALDLAAINGSGSSNQPTGILNTSGIGDVAGGTNGLAPTFAHMVELETDVATANADIGALGYLTNAKVRGKLKQTEKASSTGQFVWDGNGVNGYNAMVSNQVPSTLDKGTSTGVCSAIIFGNWNDLIIGQWGAGIDVMVDPYTGGAAGTVRVRAMQDVDIAVRHAASFSAMQDALTA
jgi:HK97 family phage major capsid protein